MGRPTEADSLGDVRHPRIGIGLGARRGDGGHESTGEVSLNHQEFADEDLTDQMILLSGIEIDRDRPAVAQFELHRRSGVHRDLAGYPCSAEWGRGGRPRNNYLVGTGQQWHGEQVAGHPDIEYSAAF